MYRTGRTRNKFQPRTHSIHSPQLARYSSPSCFVEHSGRAGIIKGGFMDFMKPQRGFILVLTIGMVSVMSIIVMRMLTDLISFQQLESVLLEREQAKQLAWSGIQLAMAQIVQKAPKAEEKLSEAEATLKKQLFRLRKV